MPTMHIAKADSLAFLIYNLTLAEAGYLEAWHPEDRDKLGDRWRTLYLQAFRTMAPGQVHDDGHHVATRHDDRIEITVRARAERMAS